MVKVPKNMMYPVRILFLLPRLILLSSLFFGPLALKAHSAPFSCKALLLPIQNLFQERSTPKRSEVRISSPMIDLLNSHSPQDPEVIRLFTRDPSLPLKSPNYIPNLADSIREAFAPWFEKRNNVTFKQMLKTQHIILTQGMDGDHPYLSTSFVQSLSKSSIGKFRYQKTSILSRAYLQFAGSDFSTLTRQSSALRAFLDESPYDREYRLPISTIPTEHQPDARLMMMHSPGGYNDFLFRYRYPSNESTRWYVAEMGKMMEKLRNLPKSDSGTGSDQKQLLDLLADYLQLFSAGLPFERVNFSIAMAQVNYILMNHGIRGIENGELDLISMMVPTPLFRTIFTDAVLNAKP